MLHRALSPLPLARKQSLVLAIPLLCSLPLALSQPLLSWPLWLATGGWALALALAAAVHRSLRHDLEQLQQALAALAAGQLQTRVALFKRDEFGITGEWINALGRRLSGLLGDVAKAAAELGHAAHEVSAASSSMRTAMERQRDLAMSSSSTLEQLSASLAVTADHMQQTAAAADQSHAAAEQGWHDVGRVARHMDELARQMQQALQRVTALEERSRDIGRIVSLIDAIAARTSLLALNAAIEAARAGEAGRGFAVVADEVRKLAEQTQNANREIGSSLKEVMHEVGDSAALIRAGEETARAGAQQASAAEQRLEHIRDEAAGARELAREMATAIIEQSAASQMLARNVEAGAQLAEANAHHIGESADVAAYLDRLSTQLQASVAASAGGAA